MTKIIDQNLASGELELLNKHKFFVDFCHLAEICGLIIHVHKCSFELDGDDRAMMDTTNCLHIAQLWIDAVPESMVGKCKVSITHEFGSVLGGQQLSLHATILGNKELHVKELNAKDFKALENLYNAIITEWLQDNAWLDLVDENFKHTRFLDMPSSFSSLEELKFKLEIMSQEESEKMK